MIVADVVIVGGGIVGLSSALAMAERNYTVAVIDSGSLEMPNEDINSRVYAINKASQSLLKDLQIWKHLDPFDISPYNKMYVWDGVNGAHIEFDSRTVASSSLGVILRETILKRALLTQIAAHPSVSLFPQRTVDKINVTEKEVVVACKQELWEGRLLMAADGANSPTRQKLNIDLKTWSYNQQALVATVAVEKPHQKTAFQVFHPSGPLAFLPLADPFLCSIVWSADPKRIEQLMSMNSQEFNQELTKAFSKRLGAVTLVDERQCYPLQMRHAKQYTHLRSLLLGDAAHTIHPLAGLGLNLGLADLKSWLNCLDSSQGLGELKHTLGAYQRERKYQVWQAILLMEGFKHLFSYSLAPISFIRGLSLSFCNEMPFLKRLFIQHASGV